MSDREEVVVPDDETTEILQCVVEEYGTGEHYIKSSEISDASRVGQSAKEVGSRMYRLAEVLDGIEVDKWGYTKGTTWCVSVSESAVETWREAGRAEGVTVDPEAFDLCSRAGDEEVQEEPQLVDRLGGSVADRIAAQANQDLSAETIGWISEQGLERLRNTTLGQFVRASDDGPPIEEVNSVLCAVEDIVDGEIGADTERKTESKRANEGVAPAE